MAKLDYQVLDDLFNAHHLFLEVTNIDVRRLRDDRSEIQIGQEVAFVATAAFRGSPTAVKQLADRLDAHDLAAGDELLVIGPDAELRSDKLEIDEDSVTLWLKDHYEFVFLLNGQPSDAFRNIGAVRVTTDVPAGHPQQMSLPWITRLNTAAVKDDYIDVDVQIVERPLTATSAPPKELLLINEFVGDGVQTRRLAARLEMHVHPELIEHVIGQRYFVALDAPGRLRLAVRFEAVPDDEKAHLPPGDTTKPEAHPAPRQPPPPASTKSKHP